MSNGETLEKPSALGDPERETRELLRERIAVSAPNNLKTLLSLAPLESIEIDRPEDYGREIEL